MKNVKKNMYEGRTKPAPEIAGPGHGATRFLKQGTTQNVMLCGLTTTDISERVDSTHQSNLASGLSSIPFQTTSGRAVGLDTLFFAEQLHAPQ